MKSAQEEIRKTAAQVLADGKADLVIGFGDSTLPMRATPCIVTHPEAAQRLVWNSYCLNNLAAYLPGCFAPDPRPKEQPSVPKVAIIVKGCDGRSAVGLIKEQQVPRENLLIIAAPCRGMLDVKVAQRMLGTDEIVAAEENDEKVTIKDETGKETKLDRDQLLAEACRFCTHRAAPVYDVMVGEDAQDQVSPADDERFEKFSSSPTSERWEQFCREISKCILCKACRSVCPNCYCKVCFAEQTRPGWMGAGDEPRDVMFYHLARIFHQAGRCVDCGACVRACCMGIDLRTFTHKLVKDAEELFNYSPGLDLDGVPLLMGFSEDDPENFITEPQ